ncbi:MAG: hypothetical protein JSV84_01975 [Gemmatimonadota bacterium]|nr:MAG: hypothetical protein JSV84_01975 [Gemmatimonadota bacterium]
MRCDKVEEHKASCTCTYDPCSRKGLCCECVAYHLRANELPGCFFPAEVERTYDRSVRRFLETYKNR